MFYVILALLLVLFYVFVAPKAIKGTIHLVIAIFLVVLLLTLALLAFLNIMDSSVEVWTGLSVLGIGAWAMRDIHSLDQEKQTPSSKRQGPPPSHRKYKTLR